MYNKLYYILIKMYFLSLTHTKLANNQLRDIIRKTVIYKYRRYCSESRSKPAEVDVQFLNG